MNSIRSAIFAAVLVGGVIFSGTAQQGPSDCKAISARLKEMISKVPGHVLTAVEDTLIATPECVCEIVKTAIEASNADADQVRQIVYIAVTTAPESAPAIAECAVAAAPAHADSVRAAFAEAFEDGTRGKKSAPSNQAARIAKTMEETPKPVAAPQSVKSAPAAPPIQPTTSPYVYAGDQTHAGGGKSVVWESGKQASVPDYGGKTLVAGPYPPDPGMEGGEIVEPPLPGDRAPNAYAGQTNAPGYSSSSIYGGTAIDLSGIYLIPPVASAAPLFTEKPQEERYTGSGSGGRSPQSPRHPHVRPPTMSPTGP